MSDQNFNPDFLTAETIKFLSESKKKIIMKINVDGEEMKAEIYVEDKN